MTAKKCAICGAEATAGDVCEKCENDDMGMRNGLHARPPMIVAVDFDGTLCVDRFPGIGEPIPLMLDLVRSLKRNGHQLILWTCRVNDRLREALEWCAANGLEFDTVNANLPGNIQQYGTDPRKVYADLYIDDKSINRLNGRLDLFKVLYQWKQ